MKSTLTFKSKAQAKRETGISYIGNVNHSTKHVKAYLYNEMVYTVYLSPAKSSGYEVCPMRTKSCTISCLHESGMNTMNMNNNDINRSRIKKTKLFFTDREFFVRWVVSEINAKRLKTIKEGFRFSVRLNNTSDLSPESFYITENGVAKNILQMFPDVQFYDYTKIPKRMELMKKYKNYDVTFSYSGENMNDCITMLKNKVRVAMVFKTVPKTYMGYKVIDGDTYDMRYLDKKNVIVGLKYKRVRNKLTIDNPFVIQ